MDPNQHYQAQQYQLAVGYQQHYQQHYGHHHYHHAHHSHQQQQQQQLQGQSQHSGAVGTTSPVLQTVTPTLSSHYQHLGYPAIAQHHPDHVTAPQHHLSSQEHQHHQPHQHQHLHQAQPQPQQQHQHQHQLLHQHHQQQQQQQPPPQQPLHSQQEQHQHLTLDHQFKIETPPSSHQANFRSSASNVDDDTGGGGGGGGAGIFSSNCSTSTSTSGGSSISSGSSHLDQFDPQQESSSSLAPTVAAATVAATEAEPRPTTTDEPAGANHRISMVKDVNIEQRSSHIIVIDVKSGRKEVLTNDQLTTSPVRLLNKTLAGFPKKTITRIKQLRRTLKNRGYAQICRTKRLDQKNKLERRNSELMDENRRKDQRIAELEKKVAHLLATLHHNANVNANVATALGECAGHHHHEFREQHFR